MSFSALKYALIAIGILALVGVVFYITNLFGQPKQQFNFNLSSQTVIQQMRELNRLETSSFTIEKVIDAGTSGNAFQEFLYGDRILLIAHGEVVAGVDMSKLTDKDIQINGTTATVTLPASQILTVTLDNSQTRVYDRKQGLLARGNKDLESQARKVATETIQDAACKGKILDQAAENAKKQLTAFLKALGFSAVTVFSSTGSC
jgi:hypothetical protein